MKPLFELSCYSIIDVLSSCARKLANSILDMMVEKVLATLSILQYTAYNAVSTVRTHGSTPPYKREVAW